MTPPDVGLDVSVLVRRPNWIQRNLTKHLPPHLSFVPLTAFSSRVSFYLFMWYQSGSTI